LAHQRALVSPSGNLAIHKIKEESKRHEAHGEPETRELITLAQTVAHGGENAHNSAESYRRLASVYGLKYWQEVVELYTIHLSDQIGQV